MNRKSNISRVLVLIFILSGFSDFALDCLAANNLYSNKSTGNERPEFQRFLKSNSLPTESNFSRTKTETECEEEINHEVAEFTAHDEGLAILASIVTVARRDISQSSHREYEPVFLRNRQFRI